MTTAVGSRPRKTTSADGAPQVADVFVIFGITGDLAKVMTFHSLYRLEQRGLLNCPIIGVAVSDWSAADLRDHARSAIEDCGEKIDDEVFNRFAARLSYVSGDFGSDETYKRVAQAVGEAQCPVFYLEIPPFLFGTVIKGLTEAGLTKTGRVVVEKPFGHDLESARALAQEIHQYIDESQLYRIDHFLGKMGLQEILYLRFANVMFEPVWNRNYIDYIEITAAETLGVENRAAFYEETGALRDMVANHMLQLLTLTAMEPPIAFDSDAVREQKVQVLRSIHPMTKDQVAARTIRGQYGPGTIDGEPVQGYRQEEGVNPNSNTETYVAVEFHVNNWRWAGVPFYVRAGKRLSRPLTEVAVHFKRTPQALFSQRPEDVHHNVVALRIQPNEGISLTFGAKTPGQHMRASIVTMDFSYRDTFGAATPVAYETLLLDAMRGDATLFTRRDEVESEWRIITPIEEAWAQLPPPRFANYAAGSEGPPEADELIQYDRHRWRPLEDKDGWRL